MEVGWYPTSESSSSRSSSLIPAGRIPVTGAAPSISDSQSVALPSCVSAKRATLLSILNMAAVPPGVGAGITKGAIWVDDPSPLLCAPFRGLPEGQAGGATKRGEYKASYSSGSNTNERPSLKLTGDRYPFMDCLMSACSHRAFRIVCCFTDVPFRLHLSVGYNPFHSLLVLHALKDGHQVVGSPSVLPPTIA